MTAKPDDLDRLIDEALSGAVAGEPRRVGAASVRQALAETSRSSPHLWLAVAALILIVFTLTLRGFWTSRSGPSVAVRPEAAGVSSAATARVETPTRPGPVVFGGPAADPSTPTAASGARRSASQVREPGLQTQAAASEPPFEGLPRLTIARLDPPEPLTPEELDANPLGIAGIEISPLTSSPLFPEQDH